MIFGVIHTFNLILYCFLVRNLLCSKMTKKVIKKLRVFEVLYKKFRKVTLATTLQFRSESMEWIFADIINSTKVPKVVKYIAITLLVGFLEFLFISIAINGVSKFAMPVGISLAIIFFIVYIYLIIKIKKYNYINKDSDD